MFSHHLELERRVFFLIFNNNSLIHIIMYLYQLLFYLYIKMSFVLSYTKVKFILFIIILYRNNKLWWEEMMMIVYSQ